MTDTPLDVLKKVRELLTPPGHWTTHAFARDKYLTVVLPNSPEAICWCLSGAIAKVDDAPLIQSPDGGTVHDLSPAADKAYMILVGVTHLDALSMFNDSSVHAEVLTAVDDSIFLEETKVGSQ